MIRLYGFQPDKDIEIQYIGLRPGEKLFEEKLMAEEGLKKTANNLIYIGCPIPFNADDFFDQLEHLMQEAYSNSPYVKDFVGKIVLTYKCKKELTI